MRIGVGLVIAIVAFCGPAVGAPLSAMRSSAAVRKRPHDTECASSSFDQEPHANRAILYPSEGEIRALCEFGDPNDWSLRVRSLIGETKLDVVGAGSFSNQVGLNFSGSLAA